jgi:hypothetical protein
LFVQSIAGLLVHPVHHEVRAIDEEAACKFDNGSEPQ